MQALDNASFSIRRGDVFGYIAPTARVKQQPSKFSCLLQDYQGEVLFNGEHIDRQHTSMHKILGYLPQSAGFQEWRTLDHALTTFGRLSGLKGEHFESRITAVLDLVRLGDVRHKNIAQLSGGITQKLGLAQALLHEPSLVVLDEPAAGLDPASRFQLKQIIKDLANGGVTVFFSSHILSDVQDVATRIAILNKGRLLKVGTPDQLQDSFQVGNIIQVVVAKETPPCEGLHSLSGVLEINQPKPDVQLLHLTPHANVDEVMAEVMTAVLNEGCHVRLVDRFATELGGSLPQICGGRFRVSAWLLYRDELKGFYKSKVMVVLWVGLPLAAVLFHYLMRDVGNTPTTLLAALVVSVIGGTLGSVMLSTTVVNEKNRHVYELFLIRPVKRYALVLGKYFAVLTCLVLTNVLSIAAGLSIDAILQTVPPSAMVTRILEAFSMGLAAMSIACASPPFRGCD